MKCATRFKVSGVSVLRSVPFGRKRRTMPFQFSFVPRSNELYGCA
jgi:hypothetical protein